MTELLAPPYIFGPMAAPEIVEYRGHRIIRDFWNHYTKFPALYDRFAIDSVQAVQELDRLLGFDGRKVLNIACGTGKDSQAIARRAESIVGIEMAESMVTFAEHRRRETGDTNMHFVRSVAENLPFPDQAFDCALSIHGAPFIGWGWENVSIGESLRVVRPNGWVAFVAEETNRWIGGFVEPFGFVHQSVEVQVDYGTVDEAVETRGCIFGEAAIDELLDRNSPLVTVPLDIWYQRK